MCKGVNDKRIYLIQQMAANVPGWLQPFMKSEGVKKLWRNYCIRKVNDMPVGEVLNEYYKVTEKQTQG